MITAPEIVLLELAATLEATGRDRVRFPDAELEQLAFDQAARAIRAVAGAEDRPTPGPEDPA